MRARFAPWLITALILAGCSGQPGDTATPPAGLLAAQQVAPAGAFMPLSPGNHWTYDRSFTIQIFPDDGPPEPLVTFIDRIDLDHVEYRTIGAREYVLEAEVFSEGGANQYLRRQDRAGYYLFQRSKDEGGDVERPTLTSARRARALHARARRLARGTGVSVASIEAHLERVEAVRRMLRGLDATPAAGPPGGPMVGELTNLAYPLHPGASWVIREIPLLHATVEAREIINGFSSWRVRLEGEFLDEDDTVHIWYSRCGEVARRFHVVSVATGPDGIRVGTAVTDDIVDVVEIDVQRGGCEVR